MLSSKTPDEPTAPARTIQGNGPPDCGATPWNMLRKLGNLGPGATEKRQAPRLGLAHGRVHSAMSTCTSWSAAGRLRLKRLRKANSRRQPPMPPRKRSTRFRPEGRRENPAQVHFPPADKAATSAYYRFRRRQSWHCSPGLTRLGPSQTFCCAIRQTSCASASPGSLARMKASLHEEVQYSSRMLHVFTLRQNVAWSPAGGPGKQYRATCLAAVCD